LLNNFEHHCLRVAVACLILLCCRPAWAQDLKLPSDAPVRIEADNLAYDNERDVYSAAGNVVIHYGDGTLTAQYVEYDRKNNLATARDGAFLKMEEDTLAGEKIVVNLQDKTGVAYNSRVFYARNHFYISGERIEKTGESTYTIEQPVATTCDGDNPDWKIAGSSMSVTLEGYGWVKNARLLTKDIPVLYTPIVAFPAKTKRQTGFLFPYLSHSKNKGGIDVELPFFWVITQQMDATFYPRFIEKRGFQGGMELRYFAGSSSFGTLYGDFMADRKNVYETGPGELARDWQGTHKRWSYYLNHYTEFEPQFYIRTDLRRVSDPWYFRDFDSHNYYLSNYSASEDDPFRKVPFQGNASLPSLESTARVFKGWDNFNLMGRIGYRDDFSTPSNSRTLQQYPEIIFTGIRQPLFSTPVYYEFTGTYDYFYRGEGRKGHYMDIAPSVSLPLSVSDYLKITPQLTLHEILWYSNREKSGYDTGRRGDSRTVINAGFNVSSRMFRVFDVNLLGWDKIRHEIRPEMVYSYIPRVRQDKILQRDETGSSWIWQDSIPDYIPRISSMLDPFTTLAWSDGDALIEQHAVAWALTNTVTARSRDKDGPFSYHEMLRFKLFQVYDINEAKRDTTWPEQKRRPFSDVGIELDFRPHPYVWLAARNSYNPYTGWKEMNYDLGLRDWRGDTLTFGYRYTQDSVEAISMDLKAVITERLSGRVALRLDRLHHHNIESTVGFMYNHQCWGLGADYTKTYDDQRIMIKVSLAGLGMLQI